VNTGSLRTRVAVMTLPLLAAVLVAVAVTVTALYRTSLDHDLRSRGLLLVLRQTLPDGTTITYRASENQVGNSVRQLLLIEIAVSMAALALAALPPLRHCCASSHRALNGARSRRALPATLPASDG
jgi:hypothetical protein